MEVKAINSETKDILVYTDKVEKKYIAIGGNRLSRGFTLEGLTINYFVRNTNYADTLLQMGRWFGYRPGYIDCCKLFSTLDSLEKFDLTTATIEDLEQKFIEMNRDPNNTPDKYALKVLKHPGTLKITRPSILKNAEEVNWSYSDTLEQTTRFDLNPDRIEKSWNSFKDHIKRFDFKISAKGDYLIYETDKINELFSFLNLPNTFNGKNNGENYFNEIIQFIKLCNENNKLNKWSIAIKIKGSGRKLEKEESGLPWVIERTQRGGPGFDTNSRWYFNLKNDRLFAAGGASSNIVTGAKDMGIRLTDSTVEMAEDEFRKQLKLDLVNKYKDKSIDEIEKKVKETNIPEKVFRQKMHDTDGVLMIYLMDLQEVFKNKNKEIPGLEEIKTTLNLEIPLIGYAIGIPPVNGDIGGVYLQSKFHSVPEPPSPDDDDFDDYKEILE
jgi:hypothetical protein